MLACFRICMAVAVALGWAIAEAPLSGQTLSFFRQFSTLAMDRGAAVATDASGVYVVFGNKPARFPYQFLAGIRKYDFQGNELWTQEFSVPGPGSAQLVGAAADGTGVYIIGYFRTATGAGPTGQFVRKYSAAGDELWTRQLELSPSLPLGGVAADATGVYVAGSRFIRKYNGAGDELWTSPAGDPRIGTGTLGVAVDPSGVYVLGLAINETNPDGVLRLSVRKLDLRGNALWTRELGPPRASTPDLIAAAVPSGFFVAGGNGASTYLRRYDAGGNELWSRPIATPYSYLYLGGVAADATGVYAVGFTPLNSLVGQCRSGSGGDSFVRKFDPDGAEVWTREFGTTDAAWASGVALDLSGVYVVGTAGSAQLVQALFRSDVLPTVDHNSSAFLAKLEKSAAVVIGSRPRIFPDCVVNAASYVGGGVTPGEIVTLFGSAMGPSELARASVNSQGILATSLAESRILFNGMPAPLLYVSDRQSSAVVPFAATGQTSFDVQVEYKGALSEAVKVPVLGSRPGIFTLDHSGQGQGAILNEDGSVNSPSNPAPRGSVISIFGTGGGEAAPGVVDGQLVGGTVPKTSLPVSVFIDDGTVDVSGEFYAPPVQLVVTYAGSSTGSVAGLLQVNVRVPAKEPGEKAAHATLSLFIGSQWTFNQVTVALR